MKNVKSEDSWIVLPPGNIAICRFPTDSIESGQRLATSTELLAANQGRPFPWGSMPDSGRASVLWKKHRVGIGGLIHDRWFVTTSGRFGGAPNVPEELPGSLRSCLLYDGGEVNLKSPEQNEGFAVIKEVDKNTSAMYRMVQMHAAEHVAADGGAIIVSPMNTTTGVVHVGFVGRCQICPNPELISFRQLQKAVPCHTFKLLPEWEGWGLEQAHAGNFP